MRVEPAVSPVVVALAGLAALAVAMGIGRFAFTPVLPMMQADAGVSVAAGGWLASANYLGYLVGSVVAIWLRLTPGTVIRVALLAISIATLGMGFASSFAVWISLRTLAGIASAWVLIFVSAWCLERLAAVGRPVLASAVFAGVGSGIAAAGGVCLILMQRRATSGDAWTALGVFSLVVTAIVWPIFRGHEVARREERHGEKCEPRWDGEAVRLILCYGAWGFGYIIPATFLPAMAREIVQDPAVFGWLWPIFGAASVAATLAAAWCSRLVDNRRLWALSQATMAVGVIVPVIWPGIFAIMCAALLVGSTLMVNTMTGMQEARQVHGTRAKRLMAAMTSAFALGQIVGPITVSSLAGAGTGFREPLVAACLVLLVSAYALRRPRRPRDMALAAISVDLRMAGVTSRSLDARVSQTRRTEDSAMSAPKDSTEQPPVRPLNHVTLLADRMPPLKPHQMNDAQRKAAEDLAVGPRGGVRGPFIPLLRSPELMRRLQKVGDYVRYESVIAPRISEFLVLIVSRHWTQQFEWSVHYPLALRAGLQPETGAALADGLRPVGMAEDEEVAYDFADELIRTHGVSDGTYRRTVTQFGEQGVIDIAGVLGYFTTVSMVLNVAHTPPPENTAVLLPAFPR